jgi:hypothetical protein
VILLRVRIPAGVAATGRGDGNDDKFFSGTFVALILAINPEGSHTPLLERLGRELRGHELVAADSPATAISAVHRRPPDLVLLPSLSEDDEAALDSALRSVPGGVLTLALPAESTADARELADRIREALSSQPAASDQQAATDAPSPQTVSPELLAAATAAIAWVKKRRAAWVEDAPREPRRRKKSKKAPPVAEPHVFETTPAGEPADTWNPPAGSLEPPETLESIDEVDLDREPAVWREVIARWLPYAGALAVVIAVVAAGVTYLPRLRTALSMGTVVLESVPSGSQVFIDGEPAGTTPVITELPAGAHTVEFRSGDMTRTTQVVAIARERVIERVQWGDKLTGTLEVSSTPTGASVLVDGVARGTTPLTLADLPPGDHAVVIESSAGTVQRMVTIEPGGRARVEESIFSGFLAVFAPFDVEITDGSRQLRLDERGRVMLAAGSYKLRIQNRALGYDAVRSVEIEPAETTTLNVTPETTINVTANEPAEVSIDGEPAGQAPIVDRAIGLGTHVVVVKSATQERQFSVTATSKPVRLDVDFSQPP